MNATVNNDWVEYLEPSEQVKLGRRWQWQAPTITQGCRRSSLQKQPP